MKPSLFSLLFFVALLNMAFSCSDDEKNDLPGEVRYRLFNEKGEETTRFREGENVTFSLLLANRSEQRILLYAFDLSDFATVRSLGNSPQETDLIGKPFEKFRCDYSNAPLVLSSNNTWDIRISWVPKPIESPLFCRLSNKAPLPKGRYRTAFSTPVTFSIDGGETKTTDPYKLSIDFEVE